MDIQRYIRAIRNPAKKAYAQAYLAWVLDGRKGHNGPEWDRTKLSYMAAQGVRMNVDGMDSNPVRVELPRAQVTGTAFQSLTKHLSTCDHCHRQAYGIGNEGHALDCPLNPAWREYDAAAQELARKGLIGAIGDPLPNLMSGDACAMIDADPEAFQEHIKGFAYALAMEAHCDSD